ncbi:alpha-2 adrenergic receptor [Trichonephila clavipes]|nr:alpha-2 adrenergic receptor [Trichonephila clavipes]
MKIGNNGNLVLGPFDESTPCLMIVLMNCQTKLRINHLTAVKSVAILERAGVEMNSASKPRGGSREGKRGHGKRGMVRGRTDRTHPLSHCTRGSVRAQLIPLIGHRHEADRE